MSSDWLSYPRLEPAVRERIDRSIHFEEGDRVPIWDVIDNRAIFNHIAGPDADLYEGMAQVYNAMQIDLCRGHGMLFEEDHETENAETNGEETRVSGGSLWRTEYAIQSLDELASYELPDVDETAIETSWLAGYLRAVELFAPLTMFVPAGGCGFHWVRGLMGWELLSLAIYDAREELERLLWGHTELLASQARAAARNRACPLYFVGDDIAYKNGTICSPTFLRETMIRQLAAVCEPLNNAGIKVIFHSDGNVMEMLDDLLDAGISGLNPIEPLAGMDIGYLKKRYGNNLILVGNVDCSHVLPRGSVEQVVEETKQCLRDAAPGGGHLIGSSSEIGPAVPLENALAFFDACRTYGRYPITL